MACLTPETTEIIVHSILHYLHRGGFSKTFKRFLSEAQIQDDTWKASSVNLEDVYCKYIKDCCQTKDNAVVESETKEKKKKKNKHELASGDETKSEAVKKPADDSTNEDNAVVEPETKTKKKKKNKQASGDEAKESKSEAVEKPVDDSTNDLEVNESKKERKDKKKKSKEQEVSTKEVGDVDVKEEKKSSKKRKRLLSDENDHLSDKMETKQTVEEATKENETELNAQKNEKPEMNGGEKPESQKSAKKQRIGSAEPKTVNAFQRVKIEQVEFAHEKLQDNSYWAKDGADIGYGAKAQEVLGQVRGRDFRHEKTKKKRGSYRGGQIDLQSHSIKFNYDDEE
ncbi:hypothetical protein M8C21_018977 [Ambrosia artemisiifolia]|uniref:Srp40 C-terminal domain-containing protein n=1 Tax=Ambrosia artemisiifolia TaxID=4212 RepID=A0AAD5CYD9_AMBAR|nr:hypothetical protein M8C21_018977 [Ambrosia artemisiifolia]